MKRVKFYKDMSILCPEGFHVMDKEELKTMNFLEGEGVCLSDPERHMIVTLGVKQVNGFTSMMMNERDIAKNMETAIRRAQEPYGYKLVDHFKRKIGGKDALGFGYEYASQEVEMYGESYSLKDGKVITYYHMYSRRGLKDENLQVWKEMLESVR